MKKTMLILVGILLISSPVFAAPFLTCDCTPAADEITGFQLQFGTQTAIDIPTAATCGSGASLVTCTAPQVLICYDLGTMPNGLFSVKALAKNLWGVSEWTNPLSATKKLPTSPSLLKITK